MRSRWCPMSTESLQLFTGGEAVAHAMRQIEPDVVPVYPITPQTPIIQKFAAFVADGRSDTEIVNVEAEHSAMSAAIGAALAGARTLTATSSQGLALMAEVVYIAAAMRAPIVVALGNRALSGPINIHADHSDSMLVRDSGAIQLFAENAQVLLPVFVCQDGFTITHSAEPVALLDDDAVREFIGDYVIPNPLLDVARPTSQGTFAMPDYYFELRHHLDVAMEAAHDVLPQLAAELSELTGRPYPALEEYQLAGAERVLVVLGSTAGTAKDVVDALRGEGEQVGIVRILSFRPFPARDLRRALSATWEAFVLDRAAAPGAAAPLFADVAAALYGSRTALRSHVYGLGGRELDPVGLRRVFAGEAPAYAGLRSERCPA